MPALQHTSSTNTNLKHESPNSIPVQQTITQNIPPLQHTSPTNTYLKHTSPAAMAVLQTRLTAYQSYKHLLITYQPYSIPVQQTLT